MGFYFPKIMPRAASEAQVLSGNGQFSGRRNPSTQKYINYKYLSPLGRHLRFHPQGNSFIKFAPFPLIKKNLIKSIHYSIVHLAFILLDKRIVNQRGHRAHTGRCVPGLHEHP
jgi:hypothetical protein